MSSSYAIYENILVLYIMLFVQKCIVYTNYFFKKFKKKIYFLL